MKTTKACKKCGGDGLCDGLVRMNPLEPKGSPARREKVWATVYCKCKAGERRHKADNHAKAS